MKNLKPFIGFFFALGIFVFTMVMASTIRQYLSFRTDVGFLQFKQQVVTNKYRMFSFMSTFSRF